MEIGLHMRTQLCIGKSWDCNLEHYSKQDQLSCMSVDGQNWVGNILFDQRWRVVNPRETVWGDGSNTFLDKINEDLGYESASNFMQGKTNWTSSF